MLKGSASDVLASFKPSTYPEDTPPGRHLLRPCWADYVSILWSVLLTARVPRIRILAGHALFAQDSGMLNAQIASSIDCGATVR